jgi:hypothetical protein
MEPGMANAETDNGSHPRLEAQQELLAIIGEIKAFQRKHHKTNGELYDACFPNPNTAPVGVERFEDFLNESKLPKRLTSIRETIESLQTGLKQAEAAHDPNHHLYKALTTKAGLCDAAREGFDLYLGKYHFWRLGLRNDLVRGTMTLYYHETGLDPHYRQEHQQEINGNIHCFAYEGPVLMMPRNLLLVGFRACEMRITDLLCTDPRKEYLSGEFLTQRHMSYEPFSGKIVLYRDDLWQCNPPSDRFLRNLLRDANLRKG